MVAGVAAGGQAVPGSTAWVCSELWCRQADLMDGAEGLAAAAVWQLAQELHERQELFFFLEVFVRGGDGEGCFLWGPQAQL